MANDAEDEQLAESAAAGDLESFRELIERHRDDVFRFAFHLLGDAHGADDAAQDVFIKAFRRMGSFDPNRGSLRGWLAAITRNTCLDAIEKRKRNPLAPDPETRFGEPGTCDNAVGSREIFSMLDTALEELGEPFRSTFILAEIEERPYQEIAEMEGISVGTVKSRISRAREKLRARLEPLRTKS